MAIQMLDAAMSGLDVSCRRVWFSAKAHGHVALSKEDVKNGYRFVVDGLKNGLQTCSATVGWESVVGGFIASPEPWNPRPRAAGLQPG